MPSAAPDHHTPDSIPSDSDEPEQGWLLSSTSPSIEPDVTGEVVPSHSDVYVTVSGPTKDCGSSQPNMTIRLSQFRNEQRRFQQSWFKSYPWLTYHVENNSASCWYCNK